MKLQCKICDNKFELENRRYNERYKRGQKIFCCSKVCYQRHRDSIKKETVSCPRCETLFSRTKLTSRKQKFCSQLCANIESQKFSDPTKISKTLKSYYSTEKGKSRMNEIAEKLRKEKPCKKCGKLIYGHKKYCSLACLSNWKKEISKTRKKLFSEGKIEVTGGTTKWLNYKNIRVQGSYEFRACIILDKLVEKKLITSWSKTKKRIRYIGTDNKSHTYLIDFEILTKSNKTLYLEIKGFVRENDPLKWAETKRQGNILLVWFNKNLLNIENKLNLHQ